MMVGLNRRLMMKSCQLFDFGQCEDVQLQLKSMVLRKQSNNFDFIFFKQKSQDFFQLNFLEIKYR